MQSVKIVLLAVAAGILYGIVHDQVTARVCVEYFTIGHPPIFPTQSPTLLAVDWGVIATWWVALPLGFALAAAARLGRWPKYDAQRLVRPLFVLLVSMAVVAVACGTIGFKYVQHGGTIQPWVEAHIPTEKRAAFIADWWAHSSSYLSGTIGGLILCIYVWSQRLKARTG